MATLIPSSNVEAAYEDMFKEITRKLYGEETGNGLHTLGTPVAQVATTGPTAPEGERSFTNLQIDRSAAPTIEYDNNAAVAANAAANVAATAAGATNVVIQQQPEGSVVVATTGGNFKSEDHLSTAFGLAALMQNGFATTTSGATGTGGTDQQQQQQTQIVQWTTPTATGGKLQSYTAVTQQQQQQHQQQQQQQQLQQQVGSSKSKSKNRNDSTTEVIYTSPSTSGNTMNSGQVQQQTTPAPSLNTGVATSSSGGNSRKKSQNNSSSHNNHQNGNNANNNGGVQVQKRYACTHCPYSTDRRDLYTRHENIHKEEKPFQCFACLKQFNRADHVKKHFLRMHRELQYDINKTRRHVPSSSTSNNGGGGGNHHAGGRGNVTITAVNTQHTNNTNVSCGSPEQKPNIIFQGANVQLDNAFLETQRQPTSSIMSIAETIEAVATAADAPLPQLKQEKQDDIVAGSGVGIGIGGVGGGNVDNGGIVGNTGAATGNLKPKREKRFTCCYCPWSGADKWGLKRHLNTHTKPFVCLLCDYKAARSERLATHVLKVHNKRACNKCSYLGDTQEEFQAHINEVHHTTHSGGGGGGSSTSSNQGGNVGGGGSVTIYTTTTTNDNGSGNITGGPLQEIIVNPTSMVGWRLSANGSLIPPHDLLTGGLPNAAAQKRGSERLFQYLEADGSDPEDYARLLKMDAISRNTASVAQDFHKAGGVQELKIPANHQLLFNNKLPSQWTTKEAAALLHSLSNNSNFANNYQQHLQQQQQHQRQKYHHQHHNNSNTNGHMRQRQHSTGEDDENTPSSASSTTSSSDDGASPLKGGGRQYATASAATTAAAMHHNNGNGGSGSYGNSEQRKAMSAFLSENFDLQETSETVIEMMAAAATANNNKRKYQQYQRLDNDEDQENQEQLIRSPPAYNNNNKVINYHNTANNNNSQHTKTRTLNQRATNAAHNNREHRLDLPHIDRDNKENDKQNAATFLTTMEYQNLNKVSTQIQNYVKDIISKYYAETPLMYPAMPTATETPHGSQQPTEPQLSQQHQQRSPPRRKRMLSETEEYIEYLRNKEDITLTITPKVSTAQKQRHTSAVSHSQLQSPTRSTLAAVTPAVTLAPIVTTMPLPIQASQPPQPQLQQQPSKRRKSLSQIATLLPLLADAACQQQYLTAPLDFSKKPTHVVNETATVMFAPTPAAPTAFNTSPTLTTTPAAAAVVAPKAAKVSVIQAAPMQKQKPQQLGSAASTAGGGCGGQSAHDKRSSRKQAQPKKIRAPPEVIVAMLRDKYLNRMVDHKLNCRACAQDKQRAAAMLVFNYHTKGSLALHKYWRHRVVKQSCRHCKKAFRRRSSLVVHCRREHRDVKQSKRRMKSVKIAGEKIKKQRKRESKKQLKKAKKAKRAALKA